MIYVIVVFALLSALLNAISAIIQRRVAGKPPPEELFRRNFMKGLLLSRVWIFAFSLQILSFIAQAVALKEGSLVLVEPLLQVDLIFLLLILHYRFSVPVGRKEWIGVLMVCTGLSSLLVSLNPITGSRPFDLTRWTPTLILTLGLIGLGIFIVRRLPHDKWRAAISGIAAGFSFALVAGFTKLVTQQITYGYLHLFFSWQIYALLVSGILGIIMTQNTFAAGPLATSQPAMEITEPLISIFFGVLLFGDMVTVSGPALAVEIIAGIVAGIGIWLMGSSKRLYIND